MCRRILALSVVLAMGCAGWAAEAGEQTAGETLKTMQEQADDLRLRDEALGELSQFLSLLRTQVRGHCYLMKSFLVAQGKLEDYVNTDIKIVESEAAYMEAVGKKKELERAGIVLPNSLMTFEQAVQFSIQYVQSEDPVQMDVADADELDMLKRSCRAKSRLAKKVFDHLTDMFREEMAMLAYLKSTGSEQAFQKYAALEVERDRQESLARGAANTAIRERMRKTSAKSRKFSRKKRMENILNEFRLNQKLTETQTKIQAAQQGGWYGGQSRSAYANRRYCDY